MTLYDHRPDDGALLDFAFARFADTRTVRLCSDDGMTYADYRHTDATRGGPIMNLTRGTVWALICAEQAIWQQTHPHAEATFA